MNEFENNPICQACGAEGLKKNVIKRNVSAAYGPVVSFNDEELVCRSCGETFSVEGSESDDKYARAFEESANKSIGLMLEYLQKSGFSFAEIERCLGLPERTLSRWKNLETTGAIAMALLRIIRPFPAVIRMAEKGFSSESAPRAPMENTILEENRQPAVIWRNLVPCSDGSDVTFVAEYNTGFPESTVKYFFNTPKRKSKAETEDEHYASA
jgi:hypothetical protein